ncbi:maleylpyruvate isomerase family mycothiol-dependent enzyme [Nocardioides sp. MH1]|uniref:maleylpyruvate isomerase family mycothiol-dependent enzyme n=1 Tax=Nocardioides sp. MH1 TaxID=3242490 RepID=UPI00351FBC75
MTYITTDRDELLHRLAEAGQRFTRLAGSVPPDTRARASDWTARDVVAHVLTVVRRYTTRDLDSWDGLSSTPAEVNEQNAAELAALVDVGMDDLVAELRKELETLTAIYREVDLDASYRFHFRTEIDGYGGLGNMIGELLVHGYDIARGAGRPWPIDDRDAQLVLNGILQVADGVLDPLATAGLDLSVLWRIGEARAMLHLEHGRGGFIDPADGPARPDVVIGGPPAATLLSLYGRIGTFEAARRGVLVRGGRRPWRALGIDRLFLR